MATTTPKRIRCQLLQTPGSPPLSSALSLGLSTSFPSRKSCSSWGSSLNFFFASFFFLGEPGLSSCRVGGEQACTVTRYDEHAFDGHIQGVLLAGALGPAEDKVEMSLDGDFPDDAYRQRAVCAVCYRTTDHTAIIPPRDIRSECPPR